MAIIGAGPVGLASAIECKRSGFSTIVVDKGSVVNSIVGYPTQMEFFSTPDLIEIGGHPFSTRRYKPVREEALDYYAGVASRERLSLSLFNRVTSIDGEVDNFVVAGERESVSCRRVIIATGFFDLPVKLNVPGEDLPHVIHYYKEPYPFFGQTVTVIGAKNSAAKVALDCHRHGAKVTLVVRDAELSPSVKYWLKPDLENRIARGEIAAHFETSVVEIRPGRLTVQARNKQVQELESDWVLAMTGYQPDFSMLESWGVSFDSTDGRAPIVDEGTYESARRGVYLAGTVCGGLNTSRWFIENGRDHARLIAKDLAASLN